MEINTGRIHIKKRSLLELVAMYIFLLPFLLSFFLDFLKLPGAIKYTADVSWVLIFFIMFVNKHIKIKKNLLPFVLFIGIWILYVFLTYIINYQSPFYFLWGIRNNLRFYIAFIAFVTFLVEDDVKVCLKFVDVLFWVNVIVAFYQFFILGYQQDYLGGIFGVEKGCNAYNAVFFAIVIIKSLLLYFKEEEKTGVCFLKIGMCLVLAALAEMKFFFVLFVMILILCTILTKITWKKFAMLLCIAVVFTISATLLTMVFGRNSSLTLQNILALVTSETYSSANDLGRFTAIPIIAERFLTNLPERLFGMGLGNADTSAFAICNTPFFQVYEHLHYTWFSSAMLFLETGFIGLGLNLFFYGLCLALSIKRYKDKTGNVLYNEIAIVFAVLCIILTFYNSAMRKEVGYIAYFFLALPFIGDETGGVSKIAKKLGNYIH